MKKGCRYPVIVEGRPHVWHCVEVIKPNCLWVVEMYGAKYKVTRDTCTLLGVEFLEKALLCPWRFNFDQEAREGALKLLAIVKKHKPNKKIPYGVWKIIARYIR